MAPARQIRKIQESRHAALSATWVLSFDFVPIVDHVNLAFHEFGHMFFGLFGELMGWLGGSPGSCSAISRQIIDGWGGSISIESAPGKGTVATIRLLSS